jgi:hypothetical protein
VKGGEGGIGAVRGSAVRREDRSRPWEEPDPPSPSTPTSPTSSTSSTPRRRRLRLPPRRRAAPPHFTNACTTACGHQGEDGHFPALVDAPAFEPRGNASPHRAAAPPPLVMPAIEPGWVKSLAGAAAFVNARTPFCLICPSRHRTPRRAARVRNPAPARSRSRACPRGHNALAPTCTPACAHANPEARLDLWSLFLAPGLVAVFRSTAPPRPRRGRVLCARGRRGEHRSLGRQVHALPPFGASSHARTCADRGRLARRHPWRRPELRRVSRRDAPSAANT